MKEIVGLVAKFPLSLKSIWIIMFDLLLRLYFVKNNWWTADQGWVMHLLLWAMFTVTSLGLLYLWIRILCRLNGILEDEDLASPVSGLLGCAMVGGCIYKAADYFSSSGIPPIETIPNNLHVMGLLTLLLLGASSMRIGVRA